MSPVPEPPITRLASHYGGPQDHVHRIVIHDEEFPVGVNSAEEIAAYDAQPTTRYAAHYAHDANSSQHMVPEGRIGFHAPPNEFSIGNEQDGFARFSSAEWQTPGSLGTIRRTAVAVREQCERHGVRKVWLSVADLKSPPPEARCQTCANRGVVAASGITSHANVSAAFHESDHYDPGTGYPVALFMSIVTETEEDLTPEEHQLLADVHAGIPQSRDLLTEYLKQTEDRISQRILDSEARQNIALAARPGSDGTVDVDALAAALREGLADDVVDELKARL